jgi:hypothetical protein
MQLGIIYRFHRSDRIDGRNFNLAVISFLNDNIAGQHRPDFVLRLQRFVGKRRITGAEYAVISEVNIQLLFEGALDIDFCQNAETLLFQGLCYSGHCLIEAQTNRLAKIICHHFLLYPIPGSILPRARVWRSAFHDLSPCKNRKAIGLCPPSLVCF